MTLFQSERMLPDHRGPNWCPSSDWDGRVDRHRQAGPQSRSNWCSSITRFDRGLRRTDSGASCPNRLQFLRSLGWNKWASSTPAILLLRPRALRARSRSRTSRSIVWVHDGLLWIRFVNEARRARSRIASEQTRRLRCTDRGDLGRQESRPAPSRVADSGPLPQWKSAIAAGSKRALPVAACRDRAGSTCQRPRVPAEGRQFCFQTVFSEI